MFSSHGSFLANSMYCKPEPRWLVQDPRYAPYCFLIAFETNQNQGGLFRICTILFSIVFETNYNQDGLFRISDTVSTLFCFLITFESSQNQDSLFIIFIFFLCSNCICNKPESMWLVQDIHILVFLLHSKQTNTKLACSGYTYFGFLIAFETNQHQAGLFRIYIFWFSYCIRNKPTPSWLVQDIHILVFLLHLKQIRTDVSSWGPTLFAW